jgi:DNA-binding CsgD family transcriptional regulator
MSVSLLKIGILVAYLVSLSMAMELDPSLLLNTPFIIMVLSGAFILTLLGRRGRSGAHGVIKDLRHNLVLTGYIVTFFAHVAFLSKSAAMEEGYRGIILNFLPLFYAYLLHTLLGFFDNEKPAGGEDVRQNPASSQAEDLEDYGLSRREIVVARELLSDLSNREIGAKLYISESTIKKHINRIYQKVGVRNRTEFILRFDRRRNRSN